MVLYPFSRNDWTPRSQSSYLKAAQEAQQRSSGKKAVSVDGIKGISKLVEVIVYKLLFFLFLIYLSPFQFHRA